MVINQFISSVVNRLPLLYEISVPSFTVPNTKYVLPTASARPITINGGFRMPGWSDIFGLNDDAPEDMAGFESSRARIDALVQREIDQGVPPSRIVLAGFSQGGALALHTVNLIYSLILAVITA
jgi:predicted esterase